MKFFYYTIDDLRRGTGRFLSRGWKMEQFQTPEEALAHYSRLSPAAEKSFGMTDGVHTLELVRCVPFFPDEREGENVLASDYSKLPLWAQCAEAARITNLCISRFNLRYAIAGNIIVPIPTADKLPKALRNKYLWMDYKGDDLSAIRWVYAAGKGWVHPKILKSEATLRPLVLKYQADGITEQGAYISLEVAPWEYELMLHRTKARLEQNKMKKENQNHEQAENRSASQL